jgi:hypothetical protein
MPTKVDASLEPDGDIHKGRNLGRFRPLRVPPGGRRRYQIAFGVDTLSCLRR